MRPDQVSPLPKPQRLNKNGHEYGCKCPSCRGARNRRSGLAKQRKVAKALGVAPKFVGQLGNEESWGLDDWACEVKSGGAVPKKVTDAFAQAEAAKAIGDPRPTLTVWCPSNSSQMLVVCRLEDFLAAIRNEGPTNAYEIRSLCRNLRSLADQIEGLSK